MKRIASEWRKKKRKKQKKKRAERLETGARIKFQKIRSEIKYVIIMMKKNIGMERQRRSEHPQSSRKEQKKNWNYTSLIICKCILFSCSWCFLCFLPIRTVFFSLSPSLVRFFRPDKLYICKYSIHSLTSDMFSAAAVAMWASAYSTTIE